MKTLLYNILLLLFPLVLFAAKGDQDIALVLKINGQAEFESQSRWQPLQKGQRLDDGAKIRTAEDALVAIVFTDDKSMMKIRGGSLVEINGDRGVKGIKKRIKLDLGSIWSRITSGGAAYRLETPSGVAAVKGTIFYTMVDQNGLTTVIGIEGIVELFNNLGSVEVGQGTTGMLSKSETPTLGPTTSYEDWATNDGETMLLEIQVENDKNESKTLRIRFEQ
ncbi:hypothetical protein GF406_17715 [candidate division KSB1 bacterium]|nr:hypothetical protein [candidate division KSB1 bacterium]